MSGCVVSNKLVWNRLLFCLSMFFLAATLMSVPAAKAQDEPSFEGATVANQMFSAGVAIEALELPVASGGNGDLTYDLRPLPPGLEFDAASRTLSGTPSDVVVFPEKVFYSMTYEVTDANGATAILTFNISVEEEDVAPNFEGATVANQMFSAGVAIEALELPVASGGNGDLTYDLRPLPPGLEFDAASRTLSGTPSEVAIFSMTYEVTDADGDAATLIFEIEIDTKPSFNGSVADQQYETGKAIGTLQLPDATVGEREEPPVYSLDGVNAQGEPEMPPGLTFDDQALTLSGTPTKSGTYTLTYRVVDSDTNMEDSDETTLNFTVDVQLTFAEAFENQTFSEGDNIELMLPAALATDNRLEYSLSGEPEIPPDLAFDAGPASRTLSGELPTDLLADNLYAESYALTYIVKVAGDDNPLNKAELGFTIVVDGMPSFGDKTALVPADPYPAGAAMSLTLPEAFSGNVELTYSLELPPDLSDLTFDPATRTLSGTPRTDRVYAADYDLTLVVEDAGGDVGGDVAELDFTIVVDGEPSFEGVTAGAEPSYPAGAEMSLTLPEPIGGNVMWEYRLKGELPPGLEFNDDPAIREISGTPPRNVLYDAEYPLILEVWDGGGDVVGGDVDELDFTIVVDGEPDFGDDKTVDAEPSYPAGAEMSLTLPDADGGNVELTYSVTLPDDLEQRKALSFLKFDPATRTLSGTPSAYRMYDAEYTLTLVVKDADEDEDTLDFTIVVNGKPIFRQEVPPQRYIADGEEKSLRLPKAVGGNVALTYHLEEDLPPGLVFNDDPTSPKIEGTLLVDSFYGDERDGYTLTYWSTDVDGDESDPLHFTIRVNGQPRFKSDVDVPAEPYPAGAAIAPLVLPEAEGGNVALEYRLNEEALPPGLVFDAASRTISGTPPKYASYAYEGYTLTYRVNDADELTDEPAPLEFTLWVNGQPRFDEGVSEQITFAEGQTIDPFVLPSASGGNGQLTYELVGTLPEGLSYDGASRTISGTLGADELYDQAEADGYALTYRVTDQDGDAPADPDPAALTFTIVVHGMPSFGDQVVEDQLYTAGEDVSLGLPEAVGGNGALTYSLNEADLPPGLAFDGSARTISGELPIEATYAESYALRYQVADVDGDVMTLRFTIAVDGIPSFVSVQDDPSYAAGAAIAPLVLPEAVGGNVDRTYRLDGVLPDGLSFDAASRTISGTPPKYASYAFEGYALTYRVKDVDDQEPAPLEFTLWVNGQPRFDEGVSEQITFAEGQTIDPFVLPSASGGNGQLTYELVGTLPEGLSYDGASRTISGTLGADELYDQAEADGYALTYRVTDQDGDAPADPDPAALTFTIVVHGMPSFGDQVVEDQLYTAGEDVSLGLPEAVGGNGALTYSLNEADLPPGLAFDGSARTISGELPVEATYAESYALRYQVADVDGDVMTLRFTIAVDGIPSFVSVQDDPSYAAGAAIAPLVLPEAVGGNVDRTYRLDGVLPDGLSFDAASRTISGTPPKYASYAFEGYALTYRVKDVDDQEPAPLEFTLWVNGQPRFDEGVSEQITFAEGQTIDPFVLPSASGGNGQLTYELVGTLPEGLSYDGASRTISGTLGADELYDQAEADGYALTYRVTDQDGDAPADPDPAALTFTIVVHGMPSFGDQVVEDQLYTAGEDVSLGLPEAVGGNGALTYSLNEADLPPGLAFDGSARTISGELPIEATYAESYALRYQVADVDGDVMTLRFTIAVDGIPSFVSAQDDPSYAAGAAIAPLVLPEAVGGNVDRTYRLDGVLPDGLSFDAASRTISGTPPKYVSYAFEGYALTYRVKDVDDQEPAPLEFTLWVNGQPRFDEGVSEQITFAEGQTIDPFVLPSASGGNGQLTYELVGTLPEGLSYDGASRTISGTLGADELYDQAEADGYALTYRVTDQDGDAPADPDPAALTFTIVVHGMPSFGDQVVEDQLYTAGEDVSLGLPEAVGGNGALTYSLNEADLPPGLAFDGSARTISGELPIEATYAESYALRYQVADVDGDVMTLRFTIAVDGIPSFVSVQDDPSYAAGAAIAPLVLPEAVGGNVDRTYRLDGVLPDGLSFDAASRTISGTPPKYASYAFEGYALTYRVKDVDDQEPAPLEFTLWVNGQPRFDEGVSEQITFAEGQTIDPFVLPSASGGNGQLTYELVGTLPEGLSYDGASRTISGTLGADELYDQAEADGYALTYRVTDQDGDAPADPDPAALTFTIVVHGMPSFGDQVVEDQLYTAGEDVSLGLPEAVGGNGALTYSLNEADLPPGLAFDGSARTISGELPIEATYAESYALRYQVADVDGDVMTLRFTIAVDGIPSFVSVQDDPSYAAGAAIAPLVLPEAVGGNVDRTYRLDGVLPDGLSFDAASRTISGTPPKYASYAFEGYALTYRVKDVDDQEPAPLEFTLWVNGQPRFDEGVSEQITFAEGQTIDPFVLPSASGGNGQLTYELVGTLPEGLSYDGASRTISGTLGADELYDQAEADGYALTYRVTDQDGDAPADPDPAALTFTIVVHGMPSFGDQVVEDQLYTAGEDVSLGLPEAVGGNGALTYSLNEADLPPGLAFDGSARTISGTPPADYLYVAEGYALTYQVADVDGDAVTLRFTIAVNGIPSFGDQVVEDQQYTVGDAVSLELPEAVGGNVALTYFLDGELPPGLAFNPTSRTISGELSPNVSYSPEGYALTYRVADVDDEEAAPLTFTIAVNGMPFFEGTITNQRVPEGEEMAPLELPAALGGNGELTYSLNEENLPPGLAFDPVARTISGTPELNVSHPAEGYALTYRVEDEDGDSAELSFFLTVDGTPTFFDATIEDRILRQNEAMDPWEFPAAAGGNGDLTYSLDMNVPGLSFDAAARTLSGTPTHTGVYRLVYQVEDIDGDSAELTFHITVDGAPSFSGDVANQTYIAGEAIEDLVLPLASGGNLLSLNPDGAVVFGELTYTLDNVPPGLTFDPNPMSPMLSGTPAEVGTYTLTYTAHDFDDNMTAEDAAILSFEVRVEESATDRFAELNEQILSKYALAIADGTNRAIENRLEHMDRAGDENRSFRFAAESTLHDMIQSGRIFENRPVNMSQVANGSSFAVPFGFGRGCILCPGSPTFWGRGDYGQMSSDDGSLDWEGNLSRAQIGLDARPGAEMLTGLALSWAQGSFDYTAPLLGEERVDGTYETRMLSLHPYVGFSPGRLGVWLTAGLGRGNLDIDDEQGTIGQQSSDTSLRTASVGASGDLLASGPTQVRVKAAATVAQVEVEGGALNVAEGGNRIAEQTVSANRLRLALKASHAYEAGMDGQVTPQLEVALRQDGGDGLTGAGVEVGGGLRYEGGGFTLEAMARSLVSDGDDAVEYKEWGAHLLLQRSAGTGGRGLSLRVMPTYGTQANSLTLWERSVAEIADRGVADAEGQLRAEVGYGLAALGGRGVYTVYSGMTQAPERMQFRLGTRFEVDSSMSVSLESARWQRMAGAADHGLLLRGRLVF